MTPVNTLMDFILNLLRNPEERARFEADPEGTLRQNGFEDLCAADVNEVLPLLMDYAPAHVAASFDREYSTGGNTTGGQTPVQPAPGESDHEAAVRQIEYVTKNYAYTDDRDTTVDNSVNQNIWADGDVRQEFDNDPVTASGDGAVAAGDDIQGNVVTGDGSAAGPGSFAGDGNLVGDDNVTGDGNLVGDNNVTGDRNAFGEGSVTGDGNQAANDSTASFGAGDASSADLYGTSVDDGSAVSVGGDATGHNEGTDVQSSGSGDTQVSVGDFNEQTDNEDSHNTDSYDTEGSYNSDSHDVSYDDSFNEDSYDTEGSYNDSHDTTDSHDDNRSFKGGDVSLIG